MSRNCDLKLPSEGPVQTAPKPDFVMFFPSLFCCQRFCCNSATILLSTNRDMLADKNVSQAVLELDDAIEHAEEISKEICPQADGEKNAHQNSNARWMFGVVAMNEGQRALLAAALKDFGIKCNSGNGGQASCNVQLQDHEGVNGLAIIGLILVIPEEHCCTVTENVEKPSFVRHFFALLARARLGLEIAEFTICFCIIIVITIDT
ncbi:hypothetical protein Tco_0454324 [Tanacetum coccineum]